MWQPMSPSAPVPKSHQPRQLHGRIGRVVGPLADRPEPEVPVERRRDGRRLRWARPIPCFQSRPARSDQTWTSRTVADHPGLDPLVGEPGALGGVPLVAHLGGDAGRARGLGQLAAFVERVRQRLLAVDVLARADRRHRRDGVDVVGRADRDGVDRCSPPCRASRGNLCSAAPWGRPGTSRRRARRRRRRGRRCWLPAGRRWRCRRPPCRRRRFPRR